MRFGLCTSGQLCTAWQDLPYLLPMLTRLPKSGNASYYLYRFCDRGQRRHGRHNDARASVFFLLSPIFFSSFRLLFLLPSFSLSLRHSTPVSRISQLVFESRSIHQTPMADNFAICYTKLPVTARYHGASCRRNIAPYANVLHLHTDADNTCRLFTHLIVDNSRVLKGR